MQTNVLKSSTNLHSLHQSPYYLTTNTSINNHHQHQNHSTNQSSSSSCEPPGTNRSTLAKGQQPPVSMAGAGKGTLLLTTKDGQPTMVVQQQPTSASVADCSGGAVTTINTSLNSVINSSASQVITINNRPLNSTLGSHQPQQILVSNTHGGVLSGNMVLNMNASRPVAPTYVNAVGNQNGPRNMAPRLVFNQPIRLGQQVITQRPAAPNLIAPVGSFGLLFF